MLIYFSGRYVSSVPWYLALLGTAAWEVSTGHDGVQRIVCGNRHRNANVWHINKLDKLEGRFLLLWSDGTHMVLFLAVAFVWKAAFPSGHQYTRNEVHRKIARRFCKVTNANHRHNSLARHHAVDACLCNHRCQLLSVMELLPSRSLSEQIP